MTNEDTRAIKEIQKNLLQISLTGKAPINLTLYQKMGLVKVIRTKVQLWNGETEMRFKKLALTDKGKMVLAQVL